jgi:hypothetical protein
MSKINFARDFYLNQVSLLLSHSKITNKENMDSLSLELNLIMVAFSIGSGVATVGQTYSFRSLFLKFN